jgi:threonine dehydrogenase-like Zn-dependent dehydrogenase
MRALVLRDFYDIAVEERPEPQPRPGEVVVAVIATGICGSDFHGYSGENGRRHPGQVMGHETVGRIDELGSGVAELAVGQLVTVNPVMSCHVCPACLSGQEQWCTRRVVLGVAPEIPAAFADRGAVQAAHIVPLRADSPFLFGTTCRMSWGRWLIPWQSVTTRYAAVCHARKIECWSLAADR